MRFVRSLWAWLREDRTWPILLLLSVVIIVFGLTMGADTANWVASLVGLWAGFCLVHMGFRFLRWGKLTANLIWGVGFAGAIAMLFVPRFFLYGTANWVSMLPMWVKVAYWAVWSFLIGFAGPARAIARQRFDEARRP